MKKSGEPYPVFEPQVHHPREPLCEGPGPFRPNVAAIILHAERSQQRVLMGERVDRPGAWQWPQGGLDQGETPEAGIVRELSEEIGVPKKAVHILYRFPFRLRYRFPVSLNKKFHPRLGQEQTFFIVTLSAEPDLEKALDQEFGRLCWLPLTQAVASAVWFKQGVCELVVAHTNEILPSLQF